MLTGRARRPTAACTNYLGANTRALTFNSAADSICASCGSVSALAGEGSSFVWHVCDSQETRNT